MKLLILPMVLLCCCAAQAQTLIHQPDGTIIDVPASQTIRIEQKQHVEQTGPSLRHRESATGRGPTISLNAADIDGKLIQGPPGVTLGKFSDGDMSSGSSAGQGAESDIVLKMTGVKSSTLGTYIIGAGVILAGGLIAYFLSSILGIVIMGTGGLIFGIGVVAEQFPWAFLLVFLLAAAAILTTGIYLVIKQRQLKQTTEQAEDNAWAMDKLVAAIDTAIKANPDNAKSLLRAIQYEADDEHEQHFRQMVTQSKKRQGIKKPNPIVEASQGR